MRMTLPSTLSMTGQNSSTIASVVIEPTRPLDQNTFMSPPEPIIDRRNASSARLPSTSARVNRSEEHTSELQSLAYLVCRLLLEKKKINTRQCHARDKYA